jgi:hypothetical protein
LQKQINIIWRQRKNYRKLICKQKNKDYELKEDGILMYRGSVYVPNYQELKNLVLREMHHVHHVGNPSYKKIVVAAKSQYFWLCMKKEVVDYIIKFL